MKTILTGIMTLLLLLGSSSVSWSQNFSEKFLEGVPPKIASVATVNSSMIELLKQWEIDEDMLNFLNEFSFLRIITIPKSANSYCEKAKKLIKEYGKSEELLSINSGKQQTLLLVFNKKANNKAGEIVFINCDDDTLTIVNITGNISIDNLGKLNSLSKSIKNL